jgi:hypothetical protein
MDTFLILNQYRRVSSYKDVVGELYHSPKRYLKKVTSPNAQFVYYESRAALLAASGSPVGGWDVTPWGTAGGMVHHGFLARPQLKRESHRGPSTNFWFGF